MKRYPATGGEDAIVGSAENNRRDRQGMESKRESSVDRAGIVIPHATEGA